MKERSINELELGFVSFIEKVGEKNIVMTEFYNFKLKFYTLQLATICYAADDMGTF